MKPEMDGCENRFCLYWQENRCQLSYITLDAPGLCESCVYLEFPENFCEWKEGGNWTSWRRHDESDRRTRGDGRPFALPPPRSPGRRRKGSPPFTGSQEIRLSSAAPPRFFAAARFLFLSAAFLVLSGWGQAYNQAR